MFVNTLKRKNPFPNPFGPALFLKLCLIRKFSYVTDQIKRRLQFKMKEKHLTLDKCQCSERYSGQLILYLSNNFHNTLILFQKFDQQSYKAKMMMIDTNVFRKLSSSHFSDQNQTILMLRFWRSEFEA